MANAFQYRTSKCKVIGKSQKKYPYYMNNQQLEEVIQEKDLGILISNDLKVSLQCQSACTRAMRIQWASVPTFKGHEPKPAMV